MNIACLTPIQHINGAWEKLNNMGDVLFYRPYADYEKAIETCKMSSIAFVNPNKMTYRLDKNLIESSSLKYIVTASTGTNHIDLAAAEKKGIVVISLTTEHQIINRITSTADHALALTLSLIRNIPKAFDSVKRYEWDYESYIGRQMNQLTIGVIGAGRLGSMYARFVSGMGANTVFYDPYVERKIAARKVDLEEFLQVCDVISLHVHLNEETKHMINKKFISQCKWNPYLINTSRGDIVNEDDVIEALENGKLKGYATDVISDEFGNVKNSKLIEASQKLNIIITPHIGGMTIEAQEIAYNSAIDLLEKHLCVKS